MMIDNIKEDSFKEAERSKQVDGNQWTPMFQNIAG